MIVLLPLLAFVFISLLVAACAMALAPAHGGAIERRLDEIAGRPEAPVRESVSYERIVNALKRGETLKALKALYILFFLIKLKTLEAI